MIPGEILTPGGTIELNARRRRLSLTVENSGDRPIQVGASLRLRRRRRAAGQVIGGGGH
jgi:urease beta subunit